MDIINIIFDKNISKNIFLKIPYTYDISRLFKYFQNNFKISTISNWILYVHIYENKKEYYKL